MIAFREFFCELDADIGQDFLIEDVGGKRPLPKMGLEALEPNLDSDRAECGSLGPRAEVHITGHIADRRLDSGPIGHVLVEGAFDADRLGVRPLLDRQLLDPAGDGPQPHGVLAHELLQLGAGKAGEFPDCADADPLQHLGGLRPDPADPRDRQRVQEGDDLLGPNDLEAVRFRHVRGHLCDRLVRGRTHGARKAFPLPHGCLDAGGVACGLIEPLHFTRHIEERLIDAHVLEDVRVGSEDLDHALRGGRIPIVVRSEENGLRGLVPRRADRHATSDPELPRFVTGRHHNAASATLFGICADDHRLADELRILPPLHAHVERIHVHMEDHAGHGPRTAWSLISLVPLAHAWRWRPSHWTQNSLPSGSCRTTQYSPGAAFDDDGTSQAFCLLAPSRRSRSTSLFTWAFRASIGTAGPPLAFRSRWRPVFPRVWGALFLKEKLGPMAGCSPNPPAEFPFSPGALHPLRAAAHVEHSRGGGLSL